MTVTVGLPSPHNDSQYNKFIINFLLMDALTASYGHSAYMPSPKQMAINTLHSPHLFMRSWHSNGHNRNNHPTPSSASSRIILDIICLIPGMSQAIQEAVNIDLLKSMTFCQLQQPIPRCVLPAVDTTRRTGRPR